MAVGVMYAPWSWILGTTSSNSQLSNRSAEGSLLEVMSRYTSLRLMNVNVCVPPAV